MTLRKALIASICAGLSLSGCKADAVTLTDDEILQALGSVRGSRPAVISQPVVDCIALLAGIETSAFTGATEAQLQALDPACVSEVDRTLALSGFEMADLSVESFRRVSLARQVLIVSERQREALAAWNEEQRQQKIDTARAELESDLAARRQQISELQDVALPRIAELRSLCLHFKAAYDRVRELDRMNSAMARGGPGACASRQPYANEEQQIQTAHQSLQDFELPADVNGFTRPPRLPSINLERLNAAIEDAQNHAQRIEATLAEVKAAQN